MNVAPPAHKIRRQIVKRQLLPKPDWLDFTLPIGHSCLITDDASSVTLKLAQSLLQQGWKVVVLQFPQPLMTHSSSLPEGLPRLAMEDWSEEHLKWQLTTIARTFGAIGAFIHLNPPLQSHSHNGKSNGKSDYEIDQMIVKQVFLMAKHLKKSLTQSSPVGRSCFLTVARLDGAFGLSQALNFSPISAGLFGLTKTLNAEWESVFCRAIDLSPHLAPEQSVQSILAELHDPNLGLTEVAYSADEVRTTLLAEID